MRRLRRVLFAGLFTLMGAAGVFMACGSSSSNKTPTSQPAASSPARATVPAAAATSSAGTLNVAARDFLFDPDKLSAKKGQAVTVNFKNDGSTAHTFTLYTDEDHTKAVPSDDSGRVSAGGSKTLTISLTSDSGDLYFRCEIHPTQMTGEITVD